MARHKPDISSQVVARKNELRTIDQQLARLARSYRMSAEPAFLAAIDDLLDRRIRLTCVLGEMLNPADRATLTEWGTMGYEGQDAA